MTSGMSTTALQTRLLDSPAGNRCFGASAIAQPADPVTCSPDRMRLSVASYYYTKDPRIASPGERRVRYWAARPGEDRSIERMSWQDHLRDIIPEPLANLVRAVRNRFWRGCNSAGS
jgi:hypothetical protein